MADKPKTTPTPPPPITNIVPVGNTSKADIVPLRTEINRRLFDYNSTINLGKPIVAETKNYPDGSSIKISRVGGVNAVYVKAPSKKYVAEEGRANLIVYTYSAVYGARLHFCNVKGSGSITVKGIQLSGGQVAGFATPQKMMTKKI